jgi:hypothetical protein
VMLRVWREVFARRWPYWPVRAAISYSQNAHHPGHTYRLDGWERMREDCGKPAGRTSSWSHSIGPGHPAYGPKTLWVWRYPSPADRPPVPAREAAGESARPPEVQEALL